MYAGPPSARKTAAVAKRQPPQTTIALTRALAFAAKVFASIKATSSTGKATKRQSIQLSGGFLKTPVVSIAKYAPMGRKEAPRKIAAAAMKKSNGDRLGFSRNSR
ncbi:hypothetical protein D9M68_956200 [compost metagenome]